MRLPRLPRLLRHRHPHRCYPFPCHCERTPGGNIHVTGTADNPITIDQPPPARPGITTRRALYDVRRLRALQLSAALALGVTGIAALRLAATDPEPMDTLLNSLSMFVCGFAFAIAVVTRSNIRHLGLARYRTPWAAADREQFMAALTVVRLLHHLTAAAPPPGTLPLSQPTADALAATVADVARFQYQLLPVDVGRQWTADTYTWLGTNPHPLIPEAPTP
jgi:hypothetical protein